MVKDDKKFYTGKKVCIACYAATYRQAKSADPVLHRARAVTFRTRFRCKKKDIAYSPDVLNPDSVLRMFNAHKVCQCCGRLLNYLAGKIHDATPTLDRVDNELGYVEGNVAVLCLRCNRLKGNGHWSEFKLILDFIKKWDNEKK